MNHPVSSTFHNPTGSAMGRQVGTSWAVLPATPNPCPETTLEIGLNLGLTVWAPCLL